jgi:hypothetical protein
MRVASETRKGPLVNSGGSARAFLIQKWCPKCDRGRQSYPQRIEPARNVVKTVLMTTFCAGSLESSADARGGCVQGGCARQMRAKRMREADVRGRCAGRMRRDGIRLARGT